MISDNQNTPIQVTPFSEFTVSPAEIRADSREQTGPEDPRLEPGEQRAEPEEVREATAEQRVEPENRPPEPESQGSKAETAEDAKLSGGGVAAMPVVVVETSGPQAVNVGQPALFRLVVSNLGDTLAENVVVEAIVPEKSELASSNPTAESCGDGRFRFPATDLASGDKRQFQVELVPTDGGHVDLTARASFTTTTQCRTRVCQPQLKLEYRGPMEADSGRPTPFKLVVSNRGDGPALDVCVQPVAAGDEAADPAADSFPTIDALAAGETRELATSLTPSGTGAIELNYVATAQGDLKSRCEAQIQIRSPRLEVEVRGPKTAYLRRGAVFGVVITNAGDIVAKDSCVTIGLPPGLRVTETDPSIDFDRSRNTIRWNLPGLEMGEERTLAFRATADQEGEQTVDVTARAASGGSAKARHATKVISRPDLTLELDYNDGQIEVDDIEDFLILVRNRGTCAASGVTVKATLPAGLEVIESGEYTSTPDDLAFQPFGLAAGANRTLRFKVRGRAPGDHVIRVFLGDETVSRETVREESIFCFDG